jgi:hypothetical protein
VHAQLLQWTHVPSPNPSEVRNMFRGISGTSASDIWAVGNYNITPAGTIPPVSHALVAHWNGAGWEHHIVQNFSNTLNTLWDVKAFAPDNVWAVGDLAGPGGASGSQIHHWNGSSWIGELVTFSDAVTSFLWGLDGVAPDDLWAVGSKTIVQVDVAVAYHYDGTEWTEHNAPTVGTHRNRFRDISAFASNDAWAVGSWANQPVGGFNFLAMHWNGTSWANTSMPVGLNGIGELTSVKMVATDDVWALASFTTGGGAIIHWDGSSWTVVEENVLGGGFAVLAPDDIYAFGNGIIHWDGTNWSMADPLSIHPSPSLQGSTVLPDGEIWAAGLESDPDFNMFTLVYRSSDINTGMGPVWNSAERLHCHPNPFTGPIVIILPWTSTGEIKFSLYDIAGRVLMRKTLTRNADRIMLDLSGDEISTGMYHISISSGGSTATARVVKE